MIRRFVKCLLIGAAILTFAAYAFAGGDKQTVIVRPQNPIQPYRPRSPQLIPIECVIDGDVIIITSSNPTTINADVYVTSTSENVASYFSAAPAETHVFYVEPQNDYLTIDIEVDGRMFTGEFYH